MNASHLAKTPRLEIAIQLTEVPDSDFDGRVWEVHDVERNRGFRVRLSAQSLTSAPDGRPPLARPWTDAEVEHAIGLAIERVLTSGGEKLAGVLYDVDVTPQELHASLRLAS